MILPTLSGFTEPIIKKILRTCSLLIRANVVTCYRITNLIQTHIIHLADKKHIVFFLYSLTYYIS